MDGATVVEAARQALTGNRRLTKARARERAQYEKCQQCIRDRAEGKISDEQEQQWLRDKGEPSWLTAKAERRRVEAEEGQAIVTNIVNPYRRDVTTRMLTLLEELINLNTAEIGEVETALRKMGVPVGSSCVVPELTNVWLSHVRDSIERALAPQQPADYRRPSVPPLDSPNYEPSPLIAVVGPAAPSIEFGFRE
jgi:hypothetical protein